MDATGETPVCIFHSDRFGHRRSEVERLKNPHGGLRKLGKGYANRLPGTERTTSTTNFVSWEYATLGMRATQGICMAS